MPSQKTSANNNHHPVVLLILDGFGISRKKKGNAVNSAKMPVYRSLLKKYPHTKLKADGLAVGLPKGEAGNSEAGHQTIGAGRAVPSDKVIINNAIKDKSFFSNSVLLDTAKHVKKHGSTLHLMGLMTNSQSAHAAAGHITVLAKMMSKQGVGKIALHVFTDGRDTPPYHALRLLTELESELPEQAYFASVSGRFYAMDRNRNWSRTKKTYEAIVHGKGRKASSAIKAIEDAYERGESDEFIEPTIIANSHKPVHVNDDDALIFWNLRSDRARQLTKPFVAKSFNGNNGQGFKRSKKVSNLFFVTLTEFGKQIDHARAAYPHYEISGTLVEALRSRKQIYIAESEKYAHVTYFFNGGHDIPRFNEDRKRIMSHHVADFSAKPQMRAKEIAKAVAKSVSAGYDFICANIANPDMVAHTGNFKATVKACEITDKAIKTALQAVKKAEGTCIITADHGNAEEVLAKDGETDTHHNANPVPFVLVNQRLKNKKLHSGTLADVAPTVLRLLDEPIPKEMRGENLIK
ncbi:2,3-bisphosphoglycerate-independent phosphoglycerate mutase [Candidatus Uhrbacteria bacterium]|nr:2,3-bisphosphoglycerate-independent phosphoglycerate mutase [Candidatus Uhrbacteria bacterium]